MPWETKLRETYNGIPEPHDIVLNWGVAAPTAVKTIDLHNLGRVPNICHVNIMTLRTPV